MQVTHEDPWASRIGKRQPSCSTRRASQLLYTLALPPSINSIALIVHHHTDASAHQLRDHISIMVELRKRKTPPPAPVRPAKKAAPKGKKAAAEDKTVVEKASDIVTEAAAVVTEAVTEAVKATEEALTDATNGKSKPAAALTPSAGPPKVGDTIDLANFGGEVETHDGQKITLAKLVEESKGGVVLFTYPKASTPGCKYARPNVRTLLIRA